MLCKTKCSQSQRGEYYTKENKRFDLKETINQVAGSCSKGIPANKIMLSEVHVQYKHCNLTA